METLIKILDWTYHPIYTPQEVMIYLLLGAMKVPKEEIIRNS
jgi:hypothetical protein